MNVVALAGGVGGAKLVHGLAQILEPEALQVIVNTGDDFWHSGLRICPDLDTVTYTLAGLASSETGWGRADETWSVFTELKRYGHFDLFQLGDRDLALHLFRTGTLASGRTLTETTREICRILGISSEVLPMSDDAIATMVTIEGGELPFQEYFVKHHWQPVVEGFRFDGVETARPTKEVCAAIEQADAVILAPSNPWVSIHPILALTGIKELLCRKQVAAVSPIIGGKAVKGPAAKMFGELGIEPSAYAVASQYKGVITTFVLDHVDGEQAGDIEAMGMQTFTADIIMRDAADRQRLAQEVLEMLQKVRL